MEEGGRKERRIFERKEVGWEDGGAMNAKEILSFHRGEEETCMIEVAGDCLQTNMPGYIQYIPVLCTGAGREEDAEVDNEGQDESAIILMWINWEQSAIFHVY